MRFLLLTVDRLIDLELYLPNLKITVFVQEDIAGFQVAMNDVSRMQKFKGAQHLINEVLDMLGEKLLARTNNTTQIGFHELADEVYVAKHLALFGNVDHV